MSDKVLLRFSIKNAKYALRTATGYSAPVSFGYADSISLDSDYSEKTIYGDGKKILTIPNDKGKTGNLVLISLNTEYEIAMGRRMVTAGGTSEIKQLSSVEHAIYFEFDYMEEDQELKTAKVILYGVTSGRPSEAFNQTTEEINNQNITYPITVKGVPLMTADGTQPYVDAKGNTVYVWQETCLATDDKYNVFGQEIHIPRVAAATTSEGI